MGQERLEPGGRPKKHQLEPEKGADGIWRLDRVRHRQFNGTYTRSSGSGYTRKECLADWEENFDKNRRKGSIRTSISTSSLQHSDTMLAAFDRYLTYQKKRVEFGKITQQTFDIYTRAIKKGEGPKARQGTIRLGTELGNLTIGEVGKPSFLVGYLNDVSAIVPGIAQRHYVVLCGVFEMLTLAGLYDVSPMAPVPKPECGAPSQRALTPREREQLYRQIKSRIKRARYFRMLYLTMLGTGMRPGEAFALWWEDLPDLDDPTSTKATMRIGTTVVRHMAVAADIRQLKRKHGTEGQYYWITLPEWLTAALRAWKLVCEPKSQQSPVFVSTRNGAIQAAAANANLEKATADSSLDWVTFGNLRDTVATHVAGKTGDPQRASAQLGHAQGASVAVRHYIDPHGYVQAVVDNSEALEDLYPVKTGTKLE